jgi:hypothetical protein
MKPIIRPGSIVKDRAAKVNFGLQVNVIDEASYEVLVAYINLDGNYEEQWMNKEQVLLVENANTNLVNPAFQ